MWFISFDESPLLLRFLPWVIERTDLVGKADDDEASVYDDAVISMTAKCLLMFDIHVNPFFCPFPFIDKDFFNFSMSKQHYGSYRTV